MKRFILPVLLGALMLGIFCFSAQPADESVLTSSRICQVAVRVLFRGYERWDTATQTSVMESMSFFVRKMAHFSEYALMGFLWYILLRRVPGNVLIALALTAFYAMTDEFHQLFVPGRSGEIRDVLIDSSGGMCGILAAFVVLCIFRCIRDRDVVNWGVWNK